LSSEARSAVWNAVAPSGYTVVVERDERQRWVVTVAGASQSRGSSLEAALLEAGGTAISREWAQRVAAAIASRRGTRQRPSSEL
jgi:hypothetical protein